VSEDAVDVVLFEIAGVRYGADLAQVRRVDVDDPHESVGFPLGRPGKARRALVFHPDGEPERRLAVDAVLGVKKISVVELRRLPPTVAATPLSLGAWLDGGQAVLLVDLLALHSPTQTEEASRVP
jgi:hypothetical protein